MLFREKNHLPRPLFAARAARCREPGDPQQRLQARSREAEHEGRVVPWNSRLHGIGTRPVQASDMAPDTRGGRAQSAACWEAQELEPNGHPAAHAITLADG